MSVESCHALNASLVHPAMPHAPPGSAFCLQRFVAIDRNFAASRLGQGDWMSQLMTASRQGAGLPLIFPAEELEISNNEADASADDSSTAAQVAVLTAIAERVMDRLNSLNAWLHSATVLPGLQVRCAC